MSLRSSVVAMLISAVCGVAAAADGMITVASPYSTTETLNRLAVLAQQRNLNIFLRINHTAGAASIGKVLRPTELLVFGNPQGGTPLMECGQTAGIDLPLKALAWQDEAGRVWLTYNDPEYIAKRHDIKPDKCPAVANMTTALRNLAAATVAVP